MIALGRSTYYRTSQADPQTALRVRLRELAASRVRYGYRRLHILLQREGWAVNAKRVYRLYTQEGLTLRRRPPKRRRSGVHRIGRRAPSRPNEQWSMDFVSDALMSGSRFRVLTIVDHFTRESPAIAVGHSMSGWHVVAVLDRLAATHGTPKRISVDNGPEFISKALDQWAYQHRVELDFIRPGKPTDNPFIESFNGSLRQECLNQHWFSSVDEARRLIEAWRTEYNHERPHSSIGNLTPTEFRGAYQPRGTS